MKSRSLPLLAALAISFAAFAQNSIEPILPKGQSQFSTYYQSTAIVNGSVLWEESFETANSQWVAGGDWAIGKPLGNVYSFQGQHCAATNLMANYSPGVVSELTTPAIGLPALQAHQRLRFSYQELFQSESDYDHLITKVTTNGGATWSELGRKSGHSNAQWRYEYIDVTHLEGQVVQFRFELHSDLSYTYLGWYLDQVRVELISNAGMPKTSTGIHVNIISLDATLFPDIFLNVNVVDDQGAVIPNLDSVNFLIYENFQTPNCMEVFPPGTGLGSRLVDIVFVMDNSGSMSDEQLAVRNNVRNFIDSLSARQVDYALGLTRYGQSANSGNPIAANGGILTTDSAYFKNTIWLQNTIDGGYEPGYESIIFSINSFNWTAGARKVIIIITDETPLQGPVTLAQCISACTAADATVFALTLTNLFSTFTPLTNATGGATFNITSPFDAILDSIANTISGNYLITYCSPDTVGDCSDRDVLLFGFRSMLEVDSDTTSYFAPDFVGPVVSLTPATLGLSISGVHTTQNILIDALVTDTCVPYVQNVVLRYRIIGTLMWTAVNMTHLGYDLYTATIPATATGAPGIEYYITATDGNFINYYPLIFPTTFPVVIPIFIDSMALNPPPVITHTVDPISPLAVPDTIYANIVDSTLIVANAKLFFRKSSGAILFQNVPMTNTAGNTWMGIIPDSMMTSLGTDYFIYAQDNTGLWSTHGTAVNPHQINQPVNFPPVINHSPIIGTYCGANLDILATVIDTTDFVANVQLWYRVTDTSFATKPFTMLAMVLQGGNLYKATIPGDSITTAGLDYFIVASDNLGLSSFHGNSIISYNIACPPIHDIGIMTIQQPVSPAPEGMNNIRVKLGNFGNVGITNAIIKWTIDGGAVNQFNWTGQLDVWFPINNLLIGSSSFSYGAHTVKVWTELPNGFIDVDNTNDTTEMSIFFCDPLNGNYTVDATLPTAGNNYNTLAEAITNLECAGVSGPVEILLAAGTYTGSLVLNTYVGMSTTNTVTFKGPDVPETFPPSDTGCAINNAVTFQHIGTASFPEVLLLKKANYFRFLNINFSSGGTSYPRVVHLSDSSSYNHFEHCRFSGVSTSTSSDVVLFASSNSLDNHNVFLNNCLLGNGRAFYLASSSTMVETGNKFLRNFIQNNNQAVYATYQNELEISGNTFIPHATSGNLYGIYVSNLDVQFKINRNKITVSRNSSGLNGIYITNSKGRSSSRAEVTNNMVYVGHPSNPTSSYTFYMNSTDSVDVLHNTLHMAEMAGGTNYGAYLANGVNIRFVNNLVSHFNTAPALYLVRIATSYIQFDYNNVYSYGLEPYRYSNVFHTRQSFFTTYGFEQNSTNYRPEFISPFDLHLNSVYIDNTGSPLSHMVAMDIDAEMRDTLTPDVGADEFVPFGLDAGILWHEPTFSTIPGPTTVQVKMYNNSVDTIHNAVLAFTDFTDTLSQSFTALGLASKDSLVLTFDTAIYNFLFRNNLFAFVVSINGVIDDRQYNDTTIVQDICAPLSGSYTIDASLPNSNSNFQSFSQAVDHLLCSGISGPVVFNIADGIYPERVSLPFIQGSSSSNTITFQGASADSSMVTMELEGTSAFNYLFRIDGAQHLFLKHLGFRNLGTTYGTSLYFSKAAKHITIENCYIEGNAAPSSNSNRSLVNTSQANGESADSVTFINNHFLYGSNAINWLCSSSDRSLYLQILENRFHNFHYVGINTNYTNRLIIRGNDLGSNGSESPTHVYGLSIVNSNDRSALDANRLYITSRYSVYGIYVSGGSAAGDSLYCSNNMVIVDRLNPIISTSYAIYGIYQTGGTNHFYAHNSVVTKRSLPSTTSYSAYFAGGTTLRVFNNAFVNLNDGYSMYRSTTTTFINHNNHFTSGNKLIRYASTDYNTLAAWTAFQGHDANSVSVDPEFYSELDLHSYSTVMNNAGISSTILTDFDGESRSATPDIGADEYSLPLLDAGLSNMQPVSHFQATYPVVVQIKNHGQNALTTATIQWSVDGIMQAPFVWTGNLATGASDPQVNLGSFAFGAGQHEVMAYVTAPNGGVDGLAVNDTARMTTPFMTTPISTYPQCYNFENGFEDWQQATDDQYDWNILSGQSSTITYRVNAAQSGNYYALLSDYDSGNDTASMYMYLNTTGTIGLKMVFWYHLHSSTSGYPNYSPALHVDVNVNGVWTNSIWSRNSNQLTGWKMDTVSLASYIGDTVIVRFRGISANFLNYTQLGIDNVCISESFPNDVGVSAISAPATGPQLGNAEPVTVTVFNFGTSAASNIPVSFQVDGQTAITETIPGPLASASSMQYTFTATGNLAGYGLHEVTAYTNLLGEQFRTNDTTRVEIINEDAVIIGTLLSVNQGLPIEPSTVYTYSQTIYKAAQIGKSGFITSIMYQYNGGPAWGPDAIEIYMGHTSKNQFTTTSDWVNINTLQLVADTGLSVVNTPGWVEIQLQTPFYYNGVDNLIVAVDENTPTSNPSSCDFYSSNLDTDYSSLRHTNNSVNPDPVSPPSGTRLQHVPNTKIWFTSGLPLTLNLSSSTDTTCTGTSVLVNAAAFGGQPPYTFSWSTGQNGASISTTISGNTTIFCTVTDGAALSEVASITIYTYGGTAVTLPSFSDMCVTDNAITLSGGLPAGGSYFINGSPGTSFNPASAGVGIHTIWYRYEDSFGCIDTAIGSITVHALPLVSLASFAAVCANDASFLLSGGSPAGGSYSGQGVTNNFFNPNLAGAGTHTITYSYTDANGCANSATNTITVNQNPAVSLAAQIPVCVNDAPFNLTGGVPVGGTYSGIGVSGGVFNPALAGVGTHAITYSYTDANNCSNLAIQNIVVNDIPAVALAPIAAVCVEAASFTLTGGTPVGGSYSGMGVSGGTFNPAMAGVGNHVITYTFADTNGCANSAVQTVMVNPLPSIVITVPSSVCIDANPVSLSATPSGGSFSGSGVSAGAFNPATAGSGAQTIYYNYTDPTTGCSNVDSATIVVHALPQLFTSALPVTCDNDAAFALNFVTPSGGSYSGPGVSGGQFNPHIAGAGNHNILYTYTDGNGCTNSTTLVAQVNASPVASLAPIGAACAADAPFALSGGLPLGGQYYVNGALSTQFTPGTLGVGTHIVLYVASNANGCSDSASQSVVVNAHPLLSLTPVAPVCTMAAAVTLNATPAGGTWAGNGVSGNTFLPMAAPVGTHTLVYSYTNAAGCSAQDSITVVVNALPAVSHTPLADICINAPAIVLSGGTPGGGSYSGPGVSAGSFNPLTAGLGTHTLTYSHTDGNGCSNSTTVQITVLQIPILSMPPVPDVCNNDAPFALVGLPAGGTFSGPGTSALGIFDPAAAGVGVHTITYSQTGANGCSASITQTVTVTAAPVVTIGALTALCANDAAITLSGGLPVGGSYSGTGVSGNQFDPAVAGAGTHAITYSYTDGVGCSNSASAAIVVYAAPAKPIIGQNGDVLTCDISGLNYQWLDAQGNPISGANGQSYTAPANGVYSVVVTNGDGCSNQSDPYNATGIGIEDLGVGFVWEVFPNPSSGEFMVRFETQSSISGQLIVEDAAGRIIYQEAITDHSGIFEKKIALENAQSGVYNVSIHANGRSITKRVVVQK